MAGLDGKADTRLKVPDGKDADLVVVIDAEDVDGEEEGGVVTLTYL